MSRLRKVSPMLFRTPCSSDSLRSLGLCLVASAVLSWLACQGLRPESILQADDAPTSASAEQAGESPPVEDSGVSQAPPAETTATPPATAEPEVPSVPQAPLPIELRPYRVLISLSFATNPEFDGRFRRQALQRLQEQVDGQLGRMWNPQYEFSLHLGPGGRHDMEHKASMLAELYSASEFDKVFWLTVSGRGSRYELAGLEWDGTLRLTGPVHVRETRDQRRIPEVLMELLLAAFRPVAFATEVEEEFLALTIRAGEFLPIEESATQFQPGDYLAMSFRYLDRQRNLQRVQPIPWTFVRVDEVERARVEASVISAFRQPIPQARRRVEVAGLLQKVVHEFTDLTILERGSPPEPLIGAPVDVMNRYPTEEDAVTDRLRLITNRQGTVSVPAFPNEPLQFLMIHSGDQVLAKVPFIPGIVQQIELEVPNDSPRLAVEGELSLMEGQLIDLVARRAVLMARAVSSAKGGRWSEVDRFVAELDQLPRLQSILDRINQLQIQGVFEAQQLRDRVQESRIRRMCRELSDLATRHLDPDRRRQFDEELRELRLLNMN